MSSPARSSRLKFKQYRLDFKAHKTEGTERTAAGHARSRKSQRTFLQLLGAFFSLLGSHRKIVRVAMFLATIATLLALVPPYGTKLVVDNVLGGIPLPPLLADGFGLPQDRGQLLTVVALGIISFSLVAMILGISGRWLSTRTTKRLQADVRRKVFEHAVRLPLDRIQKLKSGGVPIVPRMTGLGGEHWSYPVSVDGCALRTGAFILHVMVDLSLTLSATGSQPAVG